MDSPSSQQIRILCPSSKTGAVIGKGGSTVRHIQSLTGAKIRLLDDHPHLPPTEERVILISHHNHHHHPHNKKQEDAHEQGDSSNNTSKGGGSGSGEDEVEGGWGPVQKAVAKVFEKVVKGDSEEELGEGVMVTCRVLIGCNQAESVLGKGGKVLEKISGESGTQIRLLPREQIPHCASHGDELITITGSFSAVRKALVSLSSCLQDGPRAEGTYHQRNYAPNMGPESVAHHNRMVVEEEVVFKLLCHIDKVGSLIGKGGNVVRAMQNETGAYIKMGDVIPETDERIVVISARESSEQRHSPAQDAVIRVHSRIVEIGFERSSAVVARLLVHPQQIGCLLGKGGHIISEMRQLTGASIRIFPNDQAPKFTSHKDEVVQVIGSFQSVQDALYHITGRLREIIFPIKPPFASPAGPPYPPPFPEMHPPHFRPRPNPASPGYPSPVGPFHSVDHPGAPPHPPDHQPVYPYGMDHGGPPNLDRGPFPYGGERPGYGPPFENSPRSWTPQPFSNSNPRGGPDVGSAPSARNGPLGSGSQAPDFTSTSVEIVIPLKLVNHVHGENDGNLSQIRQISGANIIIHDIKPGATEGVVVVSGTSDQMRAAQSLIHAFILSGQATP